MYRDALDAMLRNWQILLFATVADMALQVYGEGRIAVIVVPSLLLYGFVLFAFHSTIQNGTSTKLADLLKTSYGPNRKFWFAIGFQLISFIILAFAIVLLLTVLLGSQTEGAGLTLYALVLAAYGIIIALFGTMIPASVMGANTGVSAAWTRARLVFWPVLWRLIVGPGLVFLLLNGVLVILAAEIGLDQFLVRTWSDFIDPVKLQATMLNRLAYYVPVALTAAALCKGYLLAEPD